MHTGQRRTRRHLLPTAQAAPGVLIDETFSTQTSPANSSDLTTTWQYQTSSSLPVCGKVEIRVEQGIERVDARGVVATATAGKAMLRVRFANGTRSARPAALIVNGTTVQQPAFEGTGGWNAWATETLSISLIAGSNTIRFSPATSAGLPNVDHLEVAAA